MVATAKGIIESIEEFDRDCEESQYTDTEVVWDLLLWIRDSLKEGLAPDEEEKP